MNIFRFTSTIPCSTCGVILLKSRARVVKTDYGETFYCSAHKPAYDRISYYGRTHLGYMWGSEKYFREVECDKNGKIKKAK